jgi:hypothetical protein
MLIVRDGGESMGLDDLSFNHTRIEQKQAERNRINDQIDTSVNPLFLQMVDVGEYRREKIDFDDGSIDNNGNMFETGGDRTRP